MGWLNINGNWIGRHSGKSWSSYWLTRTPSNLILTVISDVEIQLDWTNAGTGYDGHSIERSADGITFSEIATVTGATVHYPNTGLTAYTFYWYRIRAYKGVQYSSYLEIQSTRTNYPAIIDDGNTILWLDYDELSTITKDSNNLVSAWVDRLLSGNGVAQATGSKQPVHLEKDGVSFDGTDDWMKGLFAYAQPEFIYAVVKTLRWRLNDQILDGGTDRALLRQTDTTPGIKAYSVDAWSNANNDMVVGDWTIIRLLFNGASSKLIVDEHNAVTGNFGTGNAGGLSIGNSYSSGDSAILASQVKFKEILLRKIADTSENETLIYNYVKLKRSLNNEKKIGNYSCWGVPSLLLDPNNHSRHIILNQNYLGLPAARDGNIYYSYYTKIDNTYTALAEVFDVSEEDAYQGHVDLEYFGGKYHLAMGQEGTGFNGTIVDFESDTIEGFASHVLQNAETPTTQEIGLVPIFRFLKINDDTVWLIYYKYASGKSTVCYIVWSSTGGWDNTENLISSTEITIAQNGNVEHLTIGTGVRDGNNIFIYYSNRNTNKIMVVKSTNLGSTWGVPSDTGVTGLGISMRGMVKKYGSNYIMVYNTLASIKMAKSTDGVSFTDETIIRNCYSYPVNWDILDSQHILVLWGKRDGVGESGTDANDFNGFVHHTGDYLTT